MRLRRQAGRLIATLFILFTALVSVGLTAPVDGPFAITIRPVLWRLAVDVDIKLGTFHLHERWSAVPEPSPTTKPVGRGL